MIGSAVGMACWLDTILYIKREFMVNFMQHTHGKLLKRALTAVPSDVTSLVPDDVDILR